MNARTERTTIAAMLIVASVVFAFGGFETLAATALGAGATYLVPRLPPGGAVAVGLAGGLAVSFLSHGA